MRAPRPKPPRQGRNTRPDQAPAFTLLEVLAVLLIVLIIAALLVPNAKGLFGKVHEAACMSNMRSIQVALAGYLQDHKDVWPQGPSPAEEKNWETFWLATLQPFGIAERTWQCPAIRGMLRAQGVDDKSMPRVHYVPTMFDATPGLARRWATHPWLIERANAHGQGALICFPDGSIKAFNKVLAEQGMTP